ncbi:CGNR zinc finger domain-containing protein [Micrococcus luteus]|uniref:CGNR zinc finger domain-containing protein n=1 Tax=Micrococcus luteus TaxID=1270 RepID=UPI001364C97F|nr:ABATE domain-containing protein [Micrococcus luteus]
MSQQQADSPAPLFRMDNEQLAFRFTATRTDRHGEAVERLTTPARLADWLVGSQLLATSANVDAQQLQQARALREAIHRAGTALAAGHPTSHSDLEVINNCAAQAAGHPRLADDGVAWVSVGGDPVKVALGRVAHDAINILGGPARGQVKTCQDPRCAGLYVDSSRGKNRRWCSMDYCGNRAKKARFRSPDRPSTP